MGTVGTNDTLYKGVFLRNSHTTFKNKEIYFIYLMNVAFVSELGSALK